MANGKNQIHHVQVLASVAGTVVTNRQAQMEAVFQDPLLWKKASPERESSLHLMADDQTLQRLVFQVVVEEENKLFQTEKVSSSEIDSVLMKWKELLGNSGYEEFQKYFDASEHEIKKKLERRILLEKSLASRIRFHSSSGQIEEQGKVIQDWFSQLRSRYKILYFAGAKKAL